MKRGRKFSSLIYNINILGIIDIDKYTHMYLIYLRVHQKSWVFLGIPGIPFVSAYALVLNHANILFRSKKLKKTYLLLKSQKEMTKFHESLGSFDGGWKISNTETEICLRT
jgi:hypothetical protein